MARTDTLYQLLRAVLALTASAPLTETLGRDRLYRADLPGSMSLEADPSGAIASAELQLRTPVFLYDRQYNSVFVNGNGVLSFIRSMSRFFNVPFPLDDPAVAPLYTHVDLRGSGKIHYIETDDSEVLGQAGAIARNSFKNAQDFKPTHVFLGTWFDVGYFDRKKDKVNTFQVAISSNGTHSYAEFLYPDNGIQWVQGESHPNGLPDAKAQAGIMGGSKLYMLTGSGTDQIQNLDKLSNMHRPGQWVFQIGPIPEGHNIKLPDNFEIDQTKETVKNCRNGGYTQCHSKATCIDHEHGFCCVCKQGFFGNGKFCQPNDVPLRVIGDISGEINGQKFTHKDLQCYVQTKDGRTYTALARVPETIGDRFQLLSPMSSIISWLFAKPIGDAKNGYQLTGGVLNHTLELKFKSSGDELTIRSKYLGLDVFGQLKLESQISGYLPPVEEGARVEFGDHDILLTRISHGTIRSSTERNYRFAANPSLEHHFTEDQTINFHACGPAETVGGDNGFAAKPETSRLKLTRGITTYEGHDGIVRFATNAKIGPLEDEDPCIQGRVSCGYHSSCVAEAVSFRCICDPGYQQQYDEDGNISCVDINECSVGNHVCSPDAYCLNTEGSHACSCRPGSSGDGRVCKRMASCDDTRCSDYEQCIMMDATPICTCIPGFENTESGCYPIQRPPCNETHDCSPQATCNFNEERRMHMCNCVPGYLGNGYDCYPDTDVGIIGDERPIPQCQLEMCWCPTDWEFRNSMCVREDEGLLDHGSGEVMHEHECHADKECDDNERCSFIPAHSRYECTCHPGYHSADGQCVAGDCLSRPGQCHANARCIPAKDERGAYQCICNDGLEGDGIGQCVESHVNCNEVNNCGPNAVCQYNQTLAGYSCTCLPEYHGDGFNCTQQKSCRLNPNICSHDASCLPLESNGFTCVCKEGFVGDGTDCWPRPKHESNFLLVNHGMATHRIPFFPTMENMGNPISLAYSRMAIGIDIDCPRGKTYISDITGNKITSLNYNGSKSEIFVGQVSSTEGIAIDWVSRAIFWTDSANETIEVAHLDTKKRKILFSKDLVNPRGIAVHPHRGKIFWSDWNRVHPKLEWANEDGSGRQIFLSGENVQLPNSLAIDWYSEELCWADAGTFSINCANIDNKVVRVIARKLSYPFGLAISQNHYYWTDWKTGTIEVAVRNTGEKGPSIILPAGGSGKPYGIVAVPETCPKVSNVCQYENGHCTTEQLCLPDGQGSRTCVCADDAVGLCLDSNHSQ